MASQRFGTVRPRYIEASAVGDTPLLGIQLLAQHRSIHGSRARRSHGHSVYGIGICEGRLSQFGRRCFRIRGWRWRGALDSRFRGNDGWGRGWYRRIGRLLNWGSLLAWIVAMQRPPLCYNALMRGYGVARQTTEVR